MNIRLIGAIIAGVALVTACVDDTRATRAELLRERHPEILADTSDGALWEAGMGLCGNEDIAEGTIEQLDLVQQELSSTPDQADTWKLLIDIAGDAVVVYCPDAPLSQQLIASDPDLAELAERVPSG